MLIYIKEMMLKVIKKKLKLKNDNFKKYFNYLFKDDDEEN